MVKTLGSRMIRHFFIDQCLIDVYPSIFAAWDNTKFSHAFSINSLWPSVAIWWHRSGTTLAQVMACCLTAPSHYLNQHWLLIIGFCGIHMRAILQRVTKVTILYNKFEKYTFKITATPSRVRWANTTIVLAISTFIAMKSQPLITIKVATLLVVTFTLGQGHGMVAPRKSIIPNLKFMWKNASCEYSLILDVVSVVKMHWKVPMWTLVTYERRNPSGAHLYLHCG